MIATINPPPQGGALQGARTEVEGEGHECIKLPIGERHGDQAQDRTFRDLHVLAQQRFGLLGSDAAGEPFPLMRLYHMPITYGGITGGANVHGGRETLEPFDQIESGLSDAAHGIVKANGF